MAATSILTTPQSLIALRNLDRTDSLLTLTQERVSGGLRVSRAEDDSAAYARAQDIRGDLRALSAVQEGLNTTRGIAQVAVSGATSVSNLLGDVRQRLTELANEAVTGQQREILQDDFRELITQATNFVNNAVFNGTNLLNNETSLETLSNLNGDTISLRARNLLPDIEALGAVSLDTAAEAQEAIGNQLDRLQRSVDIALGQLGADTRALTAQNTFLSSVNDAEEEGLGRLVDADIARESARLSALQLRQQLGVQVLGVANNAPQALLSLFQ